MTRPAEVKVREGATPGTRYAEFEVGAKMGEVTFTITPDIIEEYIRAVEGDEKLYVVDGRKAADDVREKVALIRPLLRDEVKEPRI